MDRCVVCSKPGEVTAVGLAKGLGAGIPPVELRVSLCLEHAEQLKGNMVRIERLEYAD